MSELARAIATVAPESSLDDAIAGLGPEGRFVVAIDQFEEVFTLCADDAERDAFIDAITKAATRSPEKIVFIPTIRDDFYGRCAPYRELSEMLAANHVLVPPMAGDELRRAIELPARRARLRVEVALVDALVAEVAEETGGLPLLSAALVELWQAREDRWLRMSAYEQTGGVRGAVARLAEASYLQLGETERDSARGILLRLSDIGDGSVLTRRRVSISEFDVGRDAVAADVLARLTRDRLLTMSDSTVEVAHEALLREWPRLRGWLEEDVQGHQLHRHLTQAAKQWDASAREASELYRGARLSTALDWSATRSTDLNELERDFLAQSRQASERDAERQRRTNRRLRSLLIGTAVFLVVAVIAGGLALVQRGNAQERARIATARELSAAAVANLEVDPERSILLALEAVDATWDADRTVLPEAEEALHRALRRSRLVRTLPGSDGLAVSGDGKRFATTSKDGTASVWDLASGRKLLTLRGHSGAVNGIAISRDGRRLATTGADGTIRIWDGSTARQIHSMRGHRGAVWLPAFSPNGRWLVTTGEDYTTRIWDVAAGRQKHQLEGSVGEAFLPRFLAPVFSPDGSRVASPRWDGSARIWDPSTGKTVVDLSGHTWEIVALAFSQDSRRVATVSPDGVVRISDARSGKHLSTFSGHQGDVNAVAYSPDGSRIATGASDGSARLWDAATGEELLSLPGRTSEIYLVAFTPDGDRLLTTGVNGYTQIWDIGVSGGRDWLTVPGPAFRLGGVAFSPDGKTFAVPSDPSASREGSGVTIRDVGTGAVVATLRGHDALVYDFDFSVDGSKLAAAPGTGVSEDPSNRTLPIWDVKTGKLEANLTGHGDQISAAALSPDGRHAVTASYDGTLREWDIATGKQQRMLKVGADAYGLGFSPDGRLLLAGIGADGPVTIWDAATFEKRGELRGHTGYIQDIEFGPNGRVLTSSGDGTAKVWDLASRRVLLTLRGHTGPLVGVAFSPDAQRIATSSYDGTAKVWDATTGGHLFTLFGHERIVHSVAFSPDGRLLATASGDGTVALHLLPIEELRRLARDRVTRGLTDDECRQYLHVANCRARR
jgi:WD40 repeat protein